MSHLVWITVVWLSGIAVKKLAGEQLGELLKDGPTLAVRLLTVLHPDDERDQLRETYAGIFEDAGADPRYKDRPQKLLRAQYAHAVSILRDPQWRVILTARQVSQIRWAVALACAIWCVLGCVLVVKSLSQGFAFTVVLDLSVAGDLLLAASFAWLLVRPSAIPTNMLAVAVGSVVAGNALGCYLTPSSMRVAAVVGLVCAVFAPLLRRLLPSRRRGIATLALAVSPLVMVELFAAAVGRHGGVDANTASGLVFWLVVGWVLIARGVRAMRPAPTLS